MLEQQVATLGMIGEIAGCWVVNWPKACRGGKSVVLTARTKRALCLYALVSTIAFFMALASTLKGMAADLSSLTQNETPSCMGPLTVNRENPRYFSDGHGKPVYLTGSHTWNNFQETDANGLGPFNYSAYLDFMGEHHHNFMRLWVWEQAAWISTVNKKAVFYPMPYERTGPGKALDGELKFDLTTVNEKYFERMRSRVLEAQKRGIYVAVMLFQGFGIEMKNVSMDRPAKRYLKGILSRIGLGFAFTPANNPWRGHPFNKKNNINEVDGDPNGHGDGREIHTLKHPEITRLQEKYVEKVIDTLNDLDNVLWEIANESHADSTEWQYHMIDFIHEHEKTMAKQHPVLMTVQYPGGDNSVLFNSRAEGISPNQEGGFRDNPPVADGSKVIISDTDHLWGVGGSWQWVWKSFLMGMNPIFMDPYTIPDPEIQNHPTRTGWALVRNNMGYTRTFAEKVDLGKAIPRPELASSGICMAEEGSRYLVYVSAGENVTVNLSPISESFAVEWFNPITGATTLSAPTTGGGICSFRSPFDNDAILFVHERNDN